jgi:hypothetical protein
MSGPLPTTSSSISSNSLLPSSEQGVDESEVFLVTVEGDVSDAQQARLRLRGLYHGGHVDMSRTGDTRAGACETSFAVLADTAETARSHAENELRPINRRVIRVEQAG